MDEEAMDDKTQYAPPNKKKKTSVIPPTAEEITKLKENENLFNSTLFRMQIDELLLQVKPKKTDKSNLKIWLEKFITYLSTIPGSESSYLLDDHSWLKNKRIQYPLPSLPEDSKGKFQFLKPVAVKCIGSLSCNCCLGPSYSVDIAVIMPKEFFQKEDYLNARYHKKRALYLCHIAEYLLNSTALNPKSPPQFCLRSGNPLKPILLLNPSAQWSSKIKIYVHAMPQTESFKLSRFAPIKNNVRQKWWSSNHSEDELLATPHYNASISQDLVAEVNESFCYKIFEENPNLKDALMLLKVWMRQRELYENSEGFNGFLLVVLLSHLFKNRKVNPHMSSYQVVRNTWVYLSQTDWLTAGPSLAQHKSEGIPENEFHSLYDVVFVDVTGFVNLASNFSKENYLRLKEEAKLALMYIDNSCLNSFQALFMTHLPFIHQFDHIVSIKTEKILKVWNKMDKDEKKMLDLLSDNRRLFTSIVTDMLEKGLGERISQIAIENIPSLVWSVLCNPPELTWDSLVIGIKLNPEFALSVIEKGPEANLPEGAEFRKFWNPKSELRRFQDGSVCESVVWDVPDAPLARRRLITQNIVEFLLTKKLKFSPNSFCYVSNQLEEHIKDKMLSDETGFVEELSLEIIKSFDSLVRQIRGITTLPLPVTSVLGISSSLRFSDVFPPTPHEGFSKCVSNNGILIVKDVLKQDLVSAESIEAVIQLGYSKKWPENIEAIRRIRAAFIIEIGKALCDQFSLKTQPFPDCLLVFKDGYIFKLRVFYPREISLMKEITNSEGLTAYRDTPQSLKMEKTLLHLPKLSSTLHGLSQDYPGYGPTVCLVKRWLRAQMLDNELFPDIPVELIVAWTFISPEPFAIVLQPQTAFLRVLNVLACTNWCLEPVIINFNGDLERDDLTEIEQTFRCGRENNSLPGLFIATSYDKTGVVWTRDAPTLPILYHTAKLAKEALLILEKELLLSSDLKKVFRPALDFYNVIIHVSRFKNPRQSQGIDWEKRNNDTSSISGQNGNCGDPVVDFNPVQCYLHELRENYSDFALFFYDPFGGDVIGVLFKPVVNEVRDFKICHLNGRKPVLKGKEKKLIFNREAIIEDFFHLGKNLVKNIDKKVFDNET